MDIAKIVPASYPEVLTVTAMAGQLSAHTDEQLCQRASIDHENGFISPALGSLCVACRQRRSTRIHGPTIDVSRI
jgi:hypothetical protein